MLPSLARELAEGWAVARLVLGSPRRAFRLMASSHCSAAVGELQPRGKTPLPHPLRTRSGFCFSSGCTPQGTSEGGSAAPDHSAEVQVWWFDLERHCGLGNSSQDTSPLNTTYMG